MELSTEAPAKASAYRELRVARQAACGETESGLPCTSCTRKAPPQLLNRSPSGNYPGFAGRPRSRRRWRDEFIHSASIRRQSNQPAGLGAKARHDCRRHAAIESVSYTHLRAHETRHDLVCRLLLE